jgi:hypothetical protein
LANSKWVQSLFNRVTDRLQKDPHTPIYSRLEVHDGVRAQPSSGEHLDRPDGAMTGAQLRPKPNSLPNKRSPNLIVQMAAYYILPTRTAKAMSI